MIWLNLLNASRNCSSIWRGFADQLWFLNFAAYASDLGPTGGRPKAVCRKAYEKPGDIDMSLSGFLFLLCDVHNASALHSFNGYLCRLSFLNSA